MDADGLDAWQADAELAGRIDRGGRQYVAMLASRCVQLSASGVSVNADTCKVSAGVFAKRSGISTNTVKKYLRTWDALAAARIVPDRGDLVPGMYVAELPDERVWWEHYQAANRPERKEIRKPNPRNPRRDKEADDAADAVNVPDDLAFKAYDKITQRVKDQGDAIPGNVGMHFRSAVESLLDVNEGKTRPTFRELLTARLARDTESLLDNRTYISPARAYMRTFNEMTELGTQVNELVRRLAAAEAALQTERAHD